MNKKYTTGNIFVVLWTKGREVLTVFFPFSRSKANAVCIKENMTKKKMVVCMLRIDLCCI